MAKTIVGLYDDRATADRVAMALKSAGFTKDHVQYASSESGSDSDFSVDASTFRDTTSLTRYGVDEDEAGFYGEGLRRGGSLVVVRAQEQDADAAVDILAEHNPVRYDDRSTAYKASGYTGYQADAPDYSEDERQTERAQHAEQGSQRLQEIQEALKIGKKEVVRGAVRVSTRVESEDVSEQVTLREESVRVDRVDVDRELTAAEADAAFQDKTIEVVAHAEEAVVEKTARVTGEVEVGLETNQRQETVGGTVRSTHVEVDETGANMGGMDDEAHFNKTYGQSNRTYAQTKPAYDYGRTSAASYDDFDSNESRIRSDYESRTGGDGDSAWDDVKDAVRHGYTRAKNAVS